MRTECCCPAWGSPRCNDCPYTMPAFRDQPALPPPQLGWQCPKCGRGNAPWVSSCQCGPNTTASFSSNIYHHRNNTKKRSVIGRPMTRASELECIQDYRALYAKFGNKLNRETFLQHAKTARSFERRFGGWHKFVEAAMTTASRAAEEK